MTKENSKNCENKHKAKNFWLGAACGAVVGTVAGILFAPKSGEETRDDIAKSGRKLKRELEKKLKKDKTPHEQKRLTAGRVLNEGPKAEVAKDTPLDKAENED